MTDDPVARRRVLAALATLGGTASLSGCVQRWQSVTSRDAPKQVALSIVTMPTDDDPAAIRIARVLADNLEAAGIRATITTQNREELLRNVLLNQNFDLYVMRHPNHHDPDFLRPLLHSTYGAEPGWQNPFGYVNLDVDNLLEAQARLTGDDRVRTLEELQRLVARDQPFTPIAFPDEIRVARDDRIGGWSDDGIHDPLGYLRLRPYAADATATETAADRGVRMTLSDERPTKNLNPLAVEFRGNRTITGLVYDSIGRWVDGTIRPWLATSWTWNDPSTDGTLVADVTLRDDLRWHDGTPLSADDVAFTYRFLADTALGELESPVPAPCFRGRASLVDSISTTEGGADGSDRQLRFRFRPSTRAVAVRAFTVPALPAHVWEPLAEKATLSGVDPGRDVTEALVWNNREPVGSGPLRVEEARPRELLRLIPFEEHFLRRDALDTQLRRYAGGFAFDRLEFLMTPTDSAAIELLAADEADATASPVRPEDIPRIGRADHLRLYIDESRSFYHVGFNARNAPMSNPRFRRAVTQLLDFDYLANEVFGGYAAPAASPLAPYESVAPELVWVDGHPTLPFLGHDGTLDVGRARSLFRRIGYRYTDDGTLVRG